MSACGKQLALRPGPGSRLVTASPHPRGNCRMEKVSLLHQRRPERGLYQLEREGKRTQNVTTQKVTAKSSKLSGVLPAGDEAASDIQARGPRRTKQKLTSRISLLAFGDVASLNSLIATGILTFSPSGFQRPYDRERGKMLTGSHHGMPRATRELHGLPW